MTTESHFGYQKLLMYELQREFVELFQPHSHFEKPSTYFESKLPFSSKDCTTRRHAYVTNQKDESLTKSQA